MIARSNTLPIVWMTYGLAILFLIIAAAGYFIVATWSNPTTMAVAGSFVIAAYLTWLGFFIVAVPRSVSTALRVLPSIAITNPWLVYFPLAFVFNLPVGR